MKNNTQVVDVVLGLQHGDEAKAKIVHHLLKSGEYTHCLRFSGGANCGHTIYHEEQKFVVHHIPVGIFFGITSIMGSGCVLNPAALFEEIEELESQGINVREHLKIANNAHIVTEEHLDEDARDTKIGTTKRGVGPAMRSKYGRTGIRASDVPELRPFLIDVFEELSTDATILCEGAQGVWLDPDWGDYPYVTSSHTGVAAAIQNGLNPRSIRNVWGAAKSYETYVGKRNFQPSDEIFGLIQREGMEFGATTGRVRQCNWTNLDQLRQSVMMNGVNRIVVSKMDVLRNVNAWGIIKDGETKILDSEEAFRKEVKSVLNVTTGVEKIFFSDNPHDIYENQHARTVGKVSWSIAT